MAANEVMPQYELRFELESDDDPLVRELAEAITEALNRARAINTLAIQANVVIGKYSIRVIEEES